jgi:diacylglycerol kinase family enzyme
VGELGVVSVRIDHPNQLPQLAALEATHHPGLFPGWREWSTTEFVVDSDAPIEAGVDGEAVMLKPPLRFRVVPRTVRVRVPHPGHRSRLRIPSPLKTLARLASGRRTAPSKPESAAIHG